MHRILRVLCMIIRGMASVAVMPLIKALEALDRLIEDEYADEDEDGYDDGDDL